MTKQPRHCRLVAGSTEQYRTIETMHLPKRSFLGSAETNSLEECPRELGIAVKPFTAHVAARATTMYEFLKIMLRIKQRNEVPYEQAMERVLRYDRVRTTLIFVGRLPKRFRFFFSKFCAHRLIIVGWPSCTSVARSTDRASTRMNKTSHDHA